MVTSTPLITFDLSPLAFFDAQSHGLRLVASFPERIPEEESPIIRLIRTPEGNGIGVMRLNGCGEAWTVTKRGTEIERIGKWEKADFIVVLFRGG